MTTQRWGYVALGIALFILLFAIWSTPVRPMTQRTYWVMSVDTLATGHLKHTHVQVTDSVAYAVGEGDGDVHIKLQSRSGKFIIAECIPKLPCLKPKAGTRITVYGITRWDPEHQWAEVHPVEDWKLTPLTRRRNAQ